ncbi:indolepyruvate ferredoxin oxidoreductase family protein [Neptunomonas sp.]|uniref:indolepyruvate ferredoxin oxidoreductase family protein n=1 Tax=Neptunomonas sp. TaxID=1971898 RepID=UPI0025D6DB27|nr:indolepyruvate ferredoxin oxidoreductase family protein [Neptunomonas sp.]
MTSPTSTSGSPAPVTPRADATTTIATPDQLDNYALNDRYTRTQGRVFLTGTQALVRIPLVQAQLDKQNGLNTGGFISGYRGSPLGGYDQALWAAKPLLKQHNVEFIPAINEDLAATLVLGTQQVETDPDKNVDGVFSIWYGKGPGVDRAGDALKHGNTYGSSPHGGVLVIAGDDHGCVSSSMPHQSDVAFMAWFMPTINPASIAEYEEFGLWGYALSRFSGMWVGFKAISETVESACSVELKALPTFNIPDDFTSPAQGLHYRWPDLPGPQLETRIEHKLAAVQAFARANPIDKKVITSANPKLGIVSTGKAHLDLMEALQLLGLSEQVLSNLGIEIFKVGMVWPLEKNGMLDFVHGKQEILVVEEKRGIIESQIKEAMSEPDRPGEVLITGKQDENGQPLIPYVGELSPSLLASFLAARLQRLFDLTFTDELEQIKESGVTVKDPGGVRRMPYFCSGCPHNRSTKVPEGSKALAGIGCHFMASWMGRDTESLIQMGGEGVNWASKSLFTGNGHIFQNLGEGTYFHSGSMAIRQSIAAGSNITYKILFNDAVAMTGGQPVDGQITVPAIAQQVHSEGAKRVVVLSDEPEKYNGHESEFPKATSFFHRDKLDSVQRELREIKGVTVLIYDQTCAAEKRRRRKRGQFPDPAKRVMINHHVCESCGDCSVQSNCLSIVPRVTKMGVKRQIDQSSCNKDFSCVNGFCPSFVTIEGGQLRKPTGLSADAVTEQLSKIPSPLIPPLSGTYDLLVSGVGGTGVVTVGALITMAAHLEGKGSSVLDFMGFAQKGGAVLSYVRVAPSPENIHQVRTDHGRADALIACDMVVASSAKALDVLRHNHTKAVVNLAEMATADHVLYRDADIESSKRVNLLADAVGDSQFSTLDANNLALHLLGDTVFSNVMMLGYAWQKGLIPISQTALIRAIELNAVAVEKNKTAFNWGRLAATVPDYVTHAANPKPSQAAETLDQKIERLTNTLISYQNKSLADEYLQLINSIRQVEKQLQPKHGNSNEQLTDIVATQLYRLMATKDEYEVARLYTDTDFLKEVADTFEGDYKVNFNFAPPILGGKVLNGRPVKRLFGPWMLKSLRMLAKMRGIRHSILDPFRFSADRKLDRQLLASYKQVIATLQSGTTLHNYDIALQLANLPKEVRGYGPVRETAAKRAESQLETLMTQYQQAIEGAGE